MFGNEPVQFYWRTLSTELRYALVYNLSLQYIRELLFSGVLQSTEHGAMFGNGRGHLSTLSQIFAQNRCPPPLRTMLQVPNTISSTPVLLLEQMVMSNRNMVVLYSFNTKIQYEPVLLFSLETSASTSTTLYSNYLYL
jgi:hypothetical protein